MIFSTMIALVLTAVQAWLGDGTRPLWRYFFSMVFVANLCGLFIHGGGAALNRLLNGWPHRARGLPRLLFHLALGVISVLAGLALGNAVLSGSSGALAVLARPGVIIQCTFIATVIAVFMYIVRRNAERRVQAAMAEAQQKEFVAASARLLAEARLRALQAQIEPHFLYNTLANVVSLIGPQPAQAQHMLERFIDYLRASLATSRSDASTLGDEARLLGAYLDVLSVRMGERLRYRIEVPDELRDCAIAPMLLQPIVENAISHGLEPKLEGGEVSISAARSGEQLQISISDSGIGLSDTQSRKPGGGVGLGNLRERLRSLHGAAAKVELLENQPCGVTVRVTLPFNASPTSIPSAP